MNTCSEKGLWIPKYHFPRPPATVKPSMADAIWSNARLNMSPRLKFSLFGVAIMWMFAGILSLFTQNIRAIQQIRRTLPPMRRR